MVNMRTGTVLVILDTYWTFYILSWRKWMSNKIIKYKFRNKSFSGYGLNKYKNFLQSPKCDCGCNSAVQLLINDKKQLFALMNDLLLDNECNYCAIFAHLYNEEMIAAVKYFTEEDNEEVKIFSTKDNIDFFQEFDGEINFHCYGLLIEVAKGKFEIIED